MIRPFVAAEQSLPDAQMQATFLAILPRVQEFARWYFRFLTCPNRKEDCVCETIALCWLWHCRLATRSRDTRAFAVTMAHLAAKSVSSGRRLCGQERANDVMSSVCQRRHGLSIAPIDREYGDPGHIIEEALHDNTRTPVPEQVQFRCDFPDWQATLDDRLRSLVNAMMEGGTTSELANQFGVTAGRVAQLRREFHDDYVAFCG